MVGSLQTVAMVPVLNSSTAAERKYNKAHKSTRCVIERTFGIWKMRFRCIYRGLTFTPKRSQYIIVLATAGLHNKCVRKRLPLSDDYDMQDDDNVDNVGQIDMEMVEE